MKQIDYRSFKDLNDPTKRAETDDKNPTPGVIQWWTATPGHALADAVFAQAMAIIQADKARIQLYNQNARLYGNQASPVNNAGFLVNAGNVNQAAARDRIAFNVIQSCTDTLTSKIAKNKPKPFFLTKKGDSKIQQKAKKLDSFATGIFYENSAYQMMPESFRQGCVYGEGIIEVFDYHGRVRWARALPYQLLTDYLECHEGPASAKTLHRIKSLDRTTLMALLPKRATEIAALESTNQLLSGTQRSVSDTVTVLESWRLPSAPDAKDGLHCITAPGLTLMHEVYKKDFFPFAIFRYSPRLHGFWAQGLSEQLTPIQIELNRCLMSVQRSFHLGGTFKVLLHATSKVIKSHVDNTVGSIITWAGEHPPQYVTPPMVQPEIYQQIKELKQMAYEQSGLSQLSANGQKPAGLNSGEAQRVYHDIETDRFQTVGQAYEEFGLDLARISVSVARDIYEDKKTVSVTVPGKKFIQTIDWKEVDMPDDSFVLQLFPVSKLPTDPEGLLSHVQELMQAGIIDQEVGRRLLDYPDLDAQENLANAQLDYLHKVLDAIVEDGEVSPPDPHFPPAKMMKLALEYYAVGLRDNLEEERLTMLRSWISQVSQLMAAAAPQAMPGAGGPAPGQPQATPEAPPVSGLLPNAPGAPQAA